MKTLAKRLALPILLLAGLAMIAPQAAEAAPWRRHVRRHYVYRPVYVAPPVVRVPRVNVYAPGVGVHVGPGVRVRAPGVGVYVAPRYPYYYGW